MQKSSTSVINKICALLFIIVLIALFGFFGSNWYMSQFVIFKANIEKIWTLPAQSRPEHILRKIYTTYNIQIARRSQLNGLTILNNGHLVNLSTSSSPIVVDMANEVIKLSEYTNSKDTPFVFVYAPYRISGYSELPHNNAAGATFFEDAEQFISALRDAGVDTLDLRSEMIQDGVDFDSFFFIGDNHWNTAGAFYAHKKISSLLEYEYGIVLDDKYTDINQFETITYHNAFSGSYARRLDSARENIAALIPRFEAQYEIRTINPLVPEEHLEVVSTGSFIEVFAPKILENNNYDFSYSNLNIVSFDFYRYSNMSVNNDLKVLLVADSYGRPLSTYLSTAIQQLDHLYLNKPNNLRLYPMLAEEKYDLVIFLINENILGDKVSAQRGTLENTRLYFGDPIE